jgi:hypothetical protein
MLVTWILLEEGYGLACLAYTLRTLRSAVINEVDPKAYLVRAYLTSLSC